MGIFAGLSNLRFLLDTETDADSPDTAIFRTGIREAIEALFITTYGVSSGSATNDPTTDGRFYDSAGGWSNDDHNGRTLLITSGSAVGNFYTIDDTASSTTDYLDLTGDNLYGDGVRSGDNYRILYDVKNNTDGHDHDGVNSKSAVMPRGRTLIACNAELVQDANTSFNNSRVFKIYVPSNPTTLRAYFQLENQTGGETTSARIVLTDNDSTSFTTDTKTATGVGWENETCSVDASAAAAGIGFLYVQMKTTEGGTARMQGLTVIWDN